MIKRPKVEDRVEQPTLGKNGVAPAGAPFIRYHVIKPGVLPAGRYATLVYIGDYAGLMDANAKLLEWGDPSNEPDPAKYETEVAIRLADR